MELTADQCYRAVASRDARFDGRFFTAVTSTGVYCRPVCPARTPHRDRCRFFACAAAAEEAGFRPCRRCRPESAPGTPAWQGTSATVTRALRLIEAGALDTSSLDQVAERLGVSARHLRRLFHAHLGTSPLAVAQTRRLHFARRLIAETELPMVEVAGAAGFASVRRFNASFARAYGASPTAVRGAATVVGRPQRRDGRGGDALVLRLAYRPPFAWNELCRFLAPRAIPGVERVIGGVYQRAVLLDSGSGVIEVRHLYNRNALLLVAPGALTGGLHQIVMRVRALFDLDADMAAITTHLARDAQLAHEVHRRPGLRVPGAWDPFELAVRAILGQLVTVRAATTLAGRVAAAHGRAIVVADGHNWRVFPGPEALRAARLEDLGIPHARAEAIRTLAIATAEKKLDLGGFGDHAAAVGALSALPGVGPWTAEYIAMRALREPDAFPAGDLGLRAAAAGGSGRLTEAALRLRAEGWRPWRAYAAMHLWTLGANARG